MQGPYCNGLVFCLVILRILRCGVQTLVSFQEWEVSGVVVVNIGDVQVRLDPGFLRWVGGLLGLFLELLAQSFRLFPLCT